MTPINFSFHNPEFNRDTKANTLCGAEKETSLGEEI